MTGPEYWRPRSEIYCISALMIFLKFNQAVKASAADLEGKKNTHVMRVYIVIDKYDKISIETGSGPQIFEFIRMCSSCLG